MNACIPESLYVVWDTFKTDVHTGIRKIPAHLDKIDQVLESTLGMVSHIIIEAAVVLESASVKIVCFIKDNWRQLIGYILAWGIIISCTGLLYGFRSVAYPLTIGLGGGFALGVLAGLFSVNSYDKKGKYTLWNLMNQGIEGLDDGTRQIVSAVAVTVILAAAVVFPRMMGSAFGLFLAMQVTVKIATDQNLGLDPTKEKNTRVALKTDITDTREMASQALDLATALQQEATCQQKIDEIRSLALQALAQADEQQGRLDALCCTKN